MDICDFNIEHYILFVKNKVFGQTFQFAKKP